MKTIITAVSILLSVSAIAQQISSYEYITIPKELQKKVNFPKVSEALIKGLTSKKYKIIQDDMNNWPTDLVLNHCKVVKGSVLDDSTFLRNRVKVQFKDCNDKLLLEVKGTSNEKDFELGYKEAVQQALLNVPMFNPEEQTKLNTTKVETSSLPPVESNTATKSTSYTNGSLNLQLVNISKNQFILVKANSDNPFATFKETTKQGVYRVTLENGISTIGYIENGQIVIEIPQQNDSYKAETFQKK